MPKTTKSTRIFAKAAKLQPGDTIRAWRLTRHVELVVDRVELTPDRLGGRRGAYPECMARVFIVGSDGPFFTGPANHIFEIKGKNEGVKSL